jgi:type IV pilus assembly protein PilO
MDIDVKDPKFLRWVIAIVLVLAAVPLDLTSTLYPFTYASRQKMVAELEQRHQKLSRDLEKARLLVRNLERVEREYEILHEQWQVAQTLLPEQNEMPNLLRKVTAAGHQSGIEFEIFRPQSPVPRGFYTDNPVELRIHGGYHQTGVFLSRLANLNRIVNVSDLQMSGFEDQESQFATLETALKLTAYTLGPGSAGPESGANQKLANAAGEQGKDGKDDAVSQAATGTKGAAGTRH